MKQAALIELLKREYMFYAEYCVRQQTKESLYMARFPSERSRWVRAVTDAEFDNFTNG